MIKFLILKIFIISFLSSCYHLKTKKHNNVIKKKTWILADKEFYSKYYFAKGKYFLLENDYDKSNIFCFKSYNIKKNPLSGYCYLNSRYKKKLSYKILDNEIRKLNLLYPKSPYIQLLHARYIFKKNKLNFKQKFARYEKLILKYPNFGSIYIDLMNLYFDNHDYISTIKTAKRYNNLYPNNFISWLYLSKSYFNMRIYEKAIFNAKKVLSLKFNNINANMILALSYLKIKDIHSSNNYFNTLYDNNFVLENEMKHMISIIKFAYDIDEFKYIIYKNNLNKAKIYLAFYYFYEKYFDKSLHILKNLIKYDKNSDNIKYLIGLNYQYKDNYKKFKYYYSIISEESLVKSKAILNMIYYYNKNSEIYNKEILINLSKLIKMNYMDKKKYIIASQIYSNIGITKKSIEILNTGLKYYPNDITLLINLAVFYDKTGNKKKSLNIIKSILEIDQYNLHALNFIALKYLEEKKHLIAKKIIDKGIYYYPNNGYFYFSLAKYYLILKNYKQARKNINTALKLTKNSPMIFELAGDIYYKLNLYKDSDFFYKLSSKFFSNQKDKIRVKNKIKS